MHRKFFNAMYAFNIIIQSFMTLLSPIALTVFVSWLLVSRGWIGEWIYVPLVVLGVGAGLIGMVRFVMSSMAGIERLENEQAQIEKNRKRQLTERCETEENERK